MSILMEKLEKTVNLMKEGTVSIDLKPDVILTRLDDMDKINYVFSNKEDEIDDEYAKEIVSRLLVDAVNVEYMKNIRFLNKKKLLESTIILKFDVIKPESHDDIDFEEVNYLGEKVLTISVEDLEKKLSHALSNCQYNIKKKRIEGSQLQFKNYYTYDFSDNYKVLYNESIKRIFLLKK